MEDPKKNNANEISGKRHVFEFEHYTWDYQKILKCHMAKNALKQIEDERINIEKDLKILEVINEERSRQINLMVALLQTKEELERKMELPVKI